MCLLFVCRRQFAAWCCCTDAERWRHTTSGSNPSNSSRHFTFACLRVRTVWPAGDNVLPGAAALMLSTALAPQVAAIPAFAFLCVPTVCIAGDNVLPGAAALMLSMGQEASTARQYLDGSILSKWKVCAQQQQQPQQQHAHKLASL
jgi:hypothetical protein